MPLSKSKHQRELLHTRDIEVRGFKRDDGFYEVEGFVKDIRTKKYMNQWIEIPAGEPMHYMQSRLAIDSNYIVKEIEVSSDSHPYPGFCNKVVANFDVLIGSKIGGGWKKTISVIL